MTETASPAECAVPSLHQVHPVDEGKKSQPVKPQKSKKLPKISIPVVAPSKYELTKQLQVASDEDVPPTNKNKYSEKYIDEDVQDSQANRDMRQQYASKAYSLAWDSITFLFALVAGNAVWAAISGHQVISDKLFFALITGVTVNVLAAFLGVIRGLFPNYYRQKPSRRKG